MAEENILPAIIFSIFFVLAIIIGFGSWIYAYRNYKSIMDRARKIDPTVKTKADAEYVLKKDIAQSMGKFDNKE